jgi:hypothetical protein
MEDIKVKVNGRVNGIKEKTANLTDDIGDLLESYYKLGVLHVTDKATNVASFTVAIFVVSFLAMFALLFVGFGLGYWLGEKLNSMLAGFSIVAGFFIVLIGITLAFKKQLLFPFIRNIIIKNVYE